MMEVLMVLVAKHHSYDCHASRKWRSMGSLSRSSIVIPACFTDLLAAHTVQYVTTVSNDLIIIALGLGSVLDW